MKRNSFTLIELLAVIIILAVVSIIATPIVLDVVEDTKDSANRDTAYNIIDAGRLYYSESLFDKNKTNKIDNLGNIYDDIIVSGKRPENGFLYVNKNENVALSLIIDGKCYKKEFIGELTVTNDETCSLGYIGNDSVKPDITLKEPSEIDKINSNGWANTNFYVEVNVSDEDSGPFGYKWCNSNTECDPTSLVEDITGSVYVKEERENIICVIGYDRAGNASDKVCKTYKLDKTKPEFSGIEDVTINKNETLDLSSGVIASDSLSGVDEEYYNPTTVDTSVAGTTNVTYSVSDLAGNINTITRKIVVDAEVPRVVFSDDYGWHKDNFYAPVTLVDNSGLGIKEAKWCITQENTCVPNAIKGLEDINPQVTVESNNNRICVYLKDNNNKENTMCSDAYKLDKTAPTTGTFNISGTLGSNGWYTSDVTISANNGSDSLSGHDSSSVNISNITSNTTGTTITLTTTDNAGNVSSTTTIIKVDKNTPTITAKSTTNTVMAGTSANILSTYFNYSNSGVADVTSTSCYNNTTNKSITNIAEVTPGTYSITCTVNKANGYSANATTQIEMQKNGNYYFVGYGTVKNELIGTYYVYKYVYNGSSWASTKVMSADYTISAIQICGDSTDLSISVVNENTVFVGYATNYGGNTSGRYYVFKYNYNGTNWSKSNVATINYSVADIQHYGDATGIGISAVNDTTVFVAYATNSDGLDGNYYVTKYKYNGSSWISNSVTTTSYRIANSQDYGDSTNISISAVNENVIFLGTATNSRGLDGIYYVTKYAYNGTNWTSSQVMSTAYVIADNHHYGDSSNISVSAINESTVFVGYATNVDYTTGRYLTVKYAYNGTSWTGSTVLSTNYTISSSTDGYGNTTGISVSGINANTLFIGYATNYNELTGKYFVYKYTYNGTNWVNNQTMSSNYTIAQSRNYGDATTISVAN